MKTKQMALDAMLMAMCAVLGYLSVDLGNIKITFESVPIIMAALLFGAADGFAVGALGTLIYQLLRYGISVTTPLWMLPYALCGLLMGRYAERRSFALSPKQLMFIIIANELLITVLNTGVMYVDSKIYGYYSFVYIFGTVIIRFVICIVKAAVYAVLIPKLIRSIREHAAGKSGG